MTTRLQYDYGRIMKDPHDIPEVARNVYLVRPIGVCPEPTEMPEVHESRSWPFDIVAEIEVTPSMAMNFGPDIVIPANAENQRFVHKTDAIELGLQIPKGKVSIWPCYFEAGWQFATQKTHLREGAFKKLYKAAQLLPGKFGLAILDGWRSLDLQREIYQGAYTDPRLEKGYVTVPSEDPRTPPPHVTGGTVDLTLSYEGVPLALGTLFDDFSSDAHAAAFEGSADTLTRDLRRLLISSMREAGFVVLKQEWWHFEYGTRRWAALTGNEPLYGAASPIGRTQDMIDPTGGLTKEM